MNLDGLKRQALRLALSLPGPLLRLASGGAATVRSGRTLNPAFQALAFHFGDSVRTSRIEDPAHTNLMAPFDLALALAPMPSSVTTQRIPLSQAQGLSGLIVQAGPSASAAPILILLHSGQRATGDLSTLLPLAGQLAMGMGMRVVLPEFRVPPSWPYPIGLQDVTSAWTWALDNTPAGGPAPVIAGIGLGANLATVLCQDLRGGALRMPSLQILINPMTDLSHESESRKVHDRAWPLGRADIALLIDQYVPPGVDPSAPRLSPLRSPDLGGMPPAVVVTSGFDPLFDEGEAYARSLAAAGNRVRYLCFEHLVQGFVIYAGIVREAQDATRMVIEAAADLTEKVYDARSGE